MKAIWNGQVVAESDQTVSLEGNQYFPPGSLRKEFFVDSNQKTVCPYKGQASYFTLRVNDEQNEAAAWYYPEPKEGYEKIRDYVAFWKGVRVEA